MTWHPLRIAAKETQIICWEVLKKYQHEMTVEGQKMLIRVIERAQMKEAAYAPHN